MIVYLQTDDKRLETRFRQELDRLIVHDCDFALLAYTVEYDLDATWVDTTTADLGAKVLSLLNSIREEMDAES